MTPNPPSIKEKKVIIGNITGFKNAKGVIKEVRDLGFGSPAYLIEVEYGRGKKSIWLSKENFKHV